MKLEASKAKMAEYLKPSAEPPKPINPDFISLGELLLRVSRIHNIDLKESANFIGHNLFGMKGAPAWKCNGKFGIVPLGALQTECAIRELEFVFHRGEFESDDGNGASIDYEFFGFDRKEFSDFLASTVGEPLDLFCQMPDATPEPKALPVAPLVAFGGTQKKWTAEKLEDLRAYRVKHTMPETAAHFQITEQRIRALLPSEKAKKNALGVWAGLKK